MMDFIRRHQGDAYRPISIPIVLFKIVEYFELAIQYQERDTLFNQNVSYLNSKHSTWKYQHA
jgi:hypothetical protein